MKKIEISKQDLIFFINLGCSNKELAQVFECSERTIAKRKREEELLGLSTNNCTTKIIEGFRVCIGCNISVPISNFGRHKSAKSGYRSKCKKCRSLEGSEWYKNNKEIKSLQSSEHYKNNKETYLARYSKRRAQIKNAVPKWYCTEDDKIFIEMREECKRLEATTGLVYEVDHIVPLQSSLVCGLHWRENWQILTRAENRKKSNKHII